MNKTMRVFIILCLVGSLITGCQQSPRKQYYLLSATPTANHGIAITRTLGLGPIDVADYLRNSQITINRNANHLLTTDNAYWGEPLQKGIMRVLTVNLMNHQPDTIIEAFPWRSDSAPKFSLRLSIYDLQIINGEALINASWKLINNETKAVLTQQHFVRNKPSGDSPAQIAGIYSKLLVELAGEMNKAIALQN
ncbi:PqiC family protein [Cellvibrio sp. UBA7671]|uniref:PqiC family protein n=1 Tax=Cellvibrio sp. UBA7671 TaxID=1946312 RepID=UPI002F35F523